MTVTKKNTAMSLNIVDGRNRKVNMTEVRQSNILKFSE